MHQQNHEEVQEFSFTSFFLPLTTSKAINIIIIIGIIIFANSLFNGFVMDDENQIVNASLVHSLTNLPKFFTGSTFGGNGNGMLIGAYYRPIPTLILSLLYVIFGPNPLSFHAAQILLHIGNSILVFLLFLKLFGKSKTSLFLALLFLVHPINTEAVNYISAIQTTLSFFFGMLALLLFLKKSTRVQTSLVFLFLFLSLLSKETGVIFVFLLVFLQWIQKRMQDKLLYIYEGSILALYAFLRFVVAHVAIVTNKFIPLMNAPFTTKLFNIPAVIFYYFHVLIFPNNIAVDQNWVVRIPTWQDFYFPLIFCLLTAIGIIYALFYFNKKSKNDKNEFKLFLFFTLWFLFFMALTVPIIPLDFTVADRWFYFPFVGLLGMIGIVIQHIPLPKKNFHATISTVAICIIILLSLRTVVRNTNWQNGYTLYTHDVSISQNSFDLENNLGVVLLRAGDLKGAETHTKKSLALAPEFPEALVNIGIIYEKQNDISDAKKYYFLAAQKGVSIGLENYVGDLLFYDNNPSGVVKILEKNIGKYPLDQQLWIFLAIAYQQIGNQQSALKAAQYAYQLAPNQNSAYVYNQILHNEPIQLK